MPVGVIGENADLTYAAQWLGDEASLLDSLLSGKHKFTAKLKKAKHPMIIIGMGVARVDERLFWARPGRLPRTTVFYKKMERLCLYACQRVAGLDMGFLPDRGGMDIAAMAAAAKAGSLDVLWSLGADEIDTQILHHVS